MCFVKHKLPAHSHFQASSVRREDGLRRVRLGASIGQYCVLRAPIERRRALMHPVVSPWVSCQGVSQPQMFFFFLFFLMFSLNLGRWTIFQPNVQLSHEALEKRERGTPRKQ